MTQPEAIATAQGAATRFAKPFVVYRLPGWPANVLGVIAKDRGLPPEAVIVTELQPFGTVAAPAADDAQGSLF